VKVIAVIQIHADSAMSSALRTIHRARWELLVLAVILTIAGTSCRKTQANVASPNPEVMVARVVQRDVPLYYEWVGTTEGFVNAEIHPKITGYLLRQEYKDGQHVHQGQPLFQIDDREYKAALDRALGDLAQKQAEHKKNTQDLARYKPLFDAQVISRQEFDHINQTTHASEAEVQAAQAAVETAKLNLDWTRITSPIDGVAGIAKAQVGDLVSPPTVLTAVSQLDPIKVVFPISEREYLHFAEKIKGREDGTRTGGPYLEMILADGSKYKFPGQFYVANRQVNVQTGTIKLQALFPNPDYVLRPGLYAKLRSAVETQPNALLVPQSAVIEIQGQYQVAVVDKENRVTMKPVTIGKQSGDLRIISQGLSPGEQVVVEGVQKVSDGMMVTPRSQETAPLGVVPAASAPSAAASPSNPG